MENSPLLPNPHQRSNYCKSFDLTVCTAVVLFLVAILLLVNPVPPQLLAQELSVQRGTFWTLADPHMDLWYRKDRPIPCPRIASYFSNESLLSTFLPLRPWQTDNFFGNYLCDSPETLVRSAINFMCTSSTPSFVIYLGDNTAHFLEPHRSFHAIKLTSAAVTKAFSELCPGVPVIPVLGNNDLSPARNNSEIFGYYAELWRSWLPRQALLSFHLG
jgi:hypothetical protein